MSIETLTTKLLSIFPKMDARRKKFITHLFFMFVVLRGRINFTQLGRYSHYKESTFRRNFEQDFDFLRFNQALVSEVCGSELAIAFDPSFIAKSGKHTPGLAYFWSGCAGQTKKGLEIAGFGALDIERNTCFHLVAYQSLDIAKHASLLAYYTDLVKQKAEVLLNTSQYLIADAYFSKKSFVDELKNAGFELISRFRNDVALRYRYLGSHPKGKRGPKRKYAGWGDVQNLNFEHFKPIIVEPEYKAYQAVVHAKALKRWVKVVVVHYLDQEAKIKAVKVYFSTDLQQEGSDIFIYYKTRFQQEFLYRDGKQYTGLEQGQSRDKNKMHFHFNSSLTAVSLAKATEILKDEKENPKRKVFSMLNIKTLYFNDFLLNRFIKAFGISSKQANNNQEYQKLRNIGTINT